jgi:hypothetical protein
MYVGIIEDAAMKLHPLKTGKDKLPENTGVISSTP